MKSILISLLLPLFLLGLTVPLETEAVNDEADFSSAQRCKSQLEESAEKQKHRDRWLRCINKFLEIGKRSPQGPWAAAALFNAGEMYTEMYRISYAKADRQEAQNLLERVSRQYPESRYAQRADAALVALRVRPSDDTRSTPKESKPDAKPAEHGTPSGPAQEYYQKAQSAYQHIQERPALMGQREPWLRCIDYYRKAYQAEPAGPLAAASLNGIAGAFQEIYRHSWMESDRSQYINAYADLLRKFPKSPYADKARTIVGAEPSPVVEEQKGDPIGETIVESMAPPPPRDTANPIPVAGVQGAAVVESLRYWSNPRYSRVVIDASQDTTFTYRELRPDNEIGKPPRIYIDLYNSRLSRDLQKVIPINDDLLSDARAGQYSADTVRIVVDIKSFKSYKIFSLKNPFRIVLDVWGIDTEAAAPTEPPPGDRKPGHIMPGAIAKQLSLGIKRIVIDPGHGGKDFGAPGAIKGVHEKHITLQIAKRLAALVRSELQCEVIMTRTEDVYLSLEERTAIANTKNADLFISIHTNASNDHRANGIETYILNLATDDEAIRVAARENATSTKNISDLDSILKDLMQNAKVSESTRLAAFVQENMLSELKRNYSGLRSKGVKQAPFYVLLGAEMPSILVETAFISNPEECGRLVDSAYQDRISKGIAAGIKGYSHEIKPMALKN
jgi:N-acetylmuramoyl-L-alanine amidase